jgi:hypothetical protein
MVMPPCGTFHYAGVVPDAIADRESGQWQLDDQSGASRLAEGSPSASWKFWKRDPTHGTNLDRLRDNQLIGLQPRLRIRGGQLVLEAASRHRAEIRSASLELDESLIESFQGSEFLTLVRTDTADIGVSLLRGNQLLVAVGAVTATPLGDDVAVQGGPAVDYSARGPEQWPRRDTWVDVSVSGEVQRLRGGQETTIRDYRFSVVRCFQDGVPGSYESLAISFEGICSHEVTLHSAQLLTRPNAGLIMAKW